MLFLEWTLSCQLHLRIITVINLISSTTIRRQRTCNRDVEGLGGLSRALDVWLQSDFPGSDDVQQPLTPVHHPQRLNRTIMAVAGSRASLSSFLPKPKYTGEEEEVPAHAQPKGPRIVGAADVESQQLTVKVNESCTR